MRLAVLLCLLACPACAETIATDAPTLTAPPTEWLGPTRHLVIIGTAKDGGLVVFCPDAAEHACSPDGRPNNVDIRPFTLNGQAAGLAGHPAPTLAPC
jgi:myo-inositol-hexaphosphate 3-phosphohydrolase